MNHSVSGFRNNIAIHNFELLVNGQRAFIDYKLKGDKLYLIHTEVPKELEGKGIAALMVEETLKYIADNDLKIVPLCSYIQQYLQSHPQWNHLVAP